MIVGREEGPEMIRRPSTDPQRGLAGASCMTLGQKDEPRCSWVVLSRVIPVPFLVRPRQERPNHRPDGDEQLVQG